MNYSGGCPWNSREWPVRWMSGLVHRTVSGAPLGSTLSCLAPNLIVSPTEFLFSKGVVMAVEARPRRASSWPLSPLLPYSRARMACRHASRCHPWSARQLDLTRVSTGPTMANGPDSCGARCGQLCPRRGHLGARRGCVCPQRVAGVVRRLCSTVLACAWPACSRLARDSLVRALGAAHTLAVTAICQSSVSPRDSSSRYCCRCAAGSTSLSSSPR